MIQQPNINDTPLLTSFERGPQFCSQILNLGKIGTRPARLERATCGTGIRRSIQLNYGRKGGALPPFSPLGFCHNDKNFSGDPESPRPEIGIIFIKGSCRVGYDLS